MAHRVNELLGSATREAGGERGVAVVGAGASGTLTATRLLELADACDLPISVWLIDPGMETGSGVAYATDQRCHLLNVTAGKMGASPEDLGGFVRWLSERQGREVGSDEFVPRSAYGSYLADVLSSVAASTGRLLRLHERVTAVRSDGTGAVELTFAWGTNLRVDAVVLALGTFPPAQDWAPAALRASARYMGNPWAPGAVAAVPDSGDVLLVGTGLTMIDMALSLDRPGRVVHAISRRGLVPRVHSQTRAPVVPAPELRADGGLVELRRDVLHYLRGCVRAVGDWRSGVDALRPLSTALWQNLSLTDRTRFLREDQRMWDVHRHRMPPATAAALSAMRRAGRLEIRRGEVIDAVDTGTGLGVELSNRERMFVGAVMNCTGSSYELRKTDDPLVRQLFADGLVGPGPVDLGLDTDEDGKLIPRAGRSSGPLWTLGALRHGHLWETTAIPEIRVQARDVAESVLSAIFQQCGSMCS
ncbi:FAD/NAD(P)-binding protein [Allokutzneria sp. A3M-2-11 16]|uniref:FAD/NAD(P)-binding protein n=1 Tax=Allokutzneria sp. A3M-2-11 16 TaxID=2962043 RepID=UPI0020B6ABC0|nr:FAD/NAD(P)-binding protein [Allokutzneria sp. A3M-2-11 16]MCP3798457.1 FAD/NAD(P)-binding protein [Allokutzneria sp. A3M-2-11 16]